MSIDSKKIGAALLVADRFPCSPAAATSWRSSSWTGEPTTTTRTACFIIPIAAYLAWERRDRFFAAVQRPTIIDASSSSSEAACSFLAAGVLGSEFVPHPNLSSQVPRPASSWLSLFGWARLRVLAFPAGVSDSHGFRCQLSSCQIRSPLHSASAAGVRVYGEAALRERSRFRSCARVTSSHPRQHDAGGCRGLQRHPFPHIRSVTLGIVFRVFRGFSGAG